MEYAFREHNDNIHRDIKRFFCQPCGQIFSKTCTLNFHIESKHPDPNMSFQEWSCEIDIVLPKLVLNSLKKIL